MPSQNVREFLADGMYSLMPQTERLIELRRIAAEVLPANLRRHCSVANFKQGKVVIFAENSAIAAKLKLLAPGILAQMAHCANEVTGIEVVVQPSSPTPTLSKAAADLSPGAASALTQLASHLPDSELKSAINTLASKSVSKR